MKLRISCPACHKGYLLDESAAGRTFLCPACKTRVRVGTPPGASPQPSSFDPTSTLPPGSAHPIEQPATAPATAPAAAAASTATAVAPAPAATLTRPEPEVIVCPRCKLHFKHQGAASVASEGSRPVVLIVEEKGYYLETAQDALGAYCELRTAATVTEAENLLAAGGIDLIVLDVTINAGDGKRLLRSGAQKSCPILIYTARDESELYGDGWAELQTLGADDIVFQEMNVGEALSRKVGELLGRTWGNENDAE